MRKKFKKRLLGIILTILMVVSVIPVQQVQPVKAAMLTKDTPIYLDVSKGGTNGWMTAKAVFGFMSSKGGKNSKQVLMEKISDTIWKGQLQEDATNIQFLRLDPENTDNVWNRSAWSELVDGKNMFVLNGSKWDGDEGTWDTYPEGGETPDPTPSTSNTVYYKKSENSKDTNWDKATNFYVYGYNSKTDNSDIQPMRLTSTAGIYEYTFTKHYDYVIFLRTSKFTSSGKDFSNQTVDLTVPWKENANPMFTLDGGSDSKDMGKKTGTWSNNTNASTGDEVLKERFYVSTNLVDYINDARLGENNSTSGYSNNNQGTVVNDSNVYSYLDAAISGSPWYTEHGKTSNGCQYTYPLYFGNMANTGIRYGRRLENGNWYGLNNFSVGANVALEEPGTEGKKFYGAVAQGLVGNKLVDGKMVDPKNPDVVLPYFSGEEIHPYDKNGNIDASKNLSEYYNDLQFPFKQTRDKNGVITYSYDSGSDYAVYYDFEKKSFYEDPDNHIENETKNDNTAPKDGFYPLNKPEDKNNRAAVNMGFGTEFTIPFTLSKDGKINGKDITFNFTGDDDVWVFIDDYLVLDMGGAHRMARGTIDFTKKEVTVDRAFTPSVSTTDAFKGGDPRENQESVKRTKKFTQIKTDDGNFEDIMANDSKVHTLKMFYMERGMIDSNMSVSFNFSPIPSGLTLSKDVDTTPVNDGLKSDVETKDNFDFTVKDNDKDARTEYTYEKDHDGTYTENKITTNGVVEGLADNVYAKNFEYKDKDSEGNKGLKIGTEFEITEHENSNYNTRWFVTDISTGDKKGEGNTLTSNFTLGNKDSGVTKVNYNVNFVNTPKVGTVNITKAWKGDVPETLQKEDFLFKVEVDLDGAAEKDEYSTYALEYTVNGTKYKTDANGDFTLKSGQTAAFAGIPTGATVKVTETKTTDDKSWEVSGTSEKESQPVTETSNETLTIINATKTINSTNKVIYVETGKDTPYTPADVQPGYTVTATSEGLKYTDKGFKGEDPNKSYTAEYTGSNRDGAIVNGTITVLTYQATDKVYVFDYGLESNIADTSTGNGLFQGGTFYNAEAKGDMATTAKLGTIAYVPDNTKTQQTTISSDSNIIIKDDGSTKDGDPVTFKPVAFMDKAENYNYTADITKNGETLEPNNPETGTTVTGTIKTMPANVVYYEDDFNATSDNKDGTAKIVYSGTKEQEGPSLTLKQSNGQTEQYGHDDAYTTGTGDSAGSSTKMTADGYKTTASFTFKGTGFDIIARTSDTAGIVCIIEKKNGEQLDLVKTISVDTYYANGALYQIPVIHEEGLDYGTYQITLGVKATTKSSVVYLDGVRIYNPMGTESNNNYIANENDVTITKISDLVIGANADITESGIKDKETGDTITSQTIEGANAALLTYGEKLAFAAMGATRVENNETQGAGTTQSLLTYLHAGPNNEMYLDDNAMIAFVANGTPGDNSTIQIEAKLSNIDSTGAVAKDASLSLQIWNGTDDEASDIATVSSSTAMYYKIPVENCIKLADNKYLVVILGNIDAFYDNVCLSFTNLKYKGYTITNPLEDNKIVSKYIETESATQEKVFVSVDKLNLKRRQWCTANHAVVLSKDVFETEEPKFTMYYVNANGKETAISVKTTKDRSVENKYWLTFKAPNAIGNFPVQIRYVVNGVESEEYISTTMNVTR